MVFMVRGVAASMLWIEYICAGHDRQVELYIFYPICADIVEDDVFDVVAPFRSHAGGVIGFAAAVEVRHVAGGVTDYPLRVPENYLSVRIQPADTDPYTRFHAKFLHMVENRFQAPRELLGVNGPVVAF